MNIKSKKILAQILSVAVVGSAFVVPVAVMAVEATTTTVVSSATTTDTASTETTTETTTTATKPPVTTYEWYVKPTIKADDINAVGVFMTSIPYGNSAYKDYEYTYGQTIDTGYAVIKDGDFYGIIDMEGNTVLESDYVSIRGELNDHFVLYDEDDNISYFCCETGEFLEPQEPRCAWCEGYLSTTVCGSYYCYDPESDVLVYIGAMPGDDTEDVISLKGQNCSNKTIDFPEGKIIPVRMVYVVSDDEVELTDSYGIMKDGEIIIDFDYDNALSYKDGITALEKDGEWYYFDEDGYQIIEDPCDASYSFNAVGGNYIPYLPSEDYIAFNTGWGGGYYATDGEVVIPVGEFAEVRPVCNGLAWVKDHSTGLWGVIELTGERAGTSNNDNDSNSDSSSGNGSGSGSNSSSSSSGSKVKDSPKTGDASGKVLAVLALSAGVMLASKKRKEK
ncbi:MAG: WG repeat-containing protein [Ruminococcus sp.]|nr:WG repeat-containing protein [Ruminococcus sp.]